MRKVSCDLADGGEYAESFGLSTLTGAIRGNFLSNKIVMLQESVEDTPEIRDLARFLSLYNSETDRGAALAACAHFDTLLERMLNAHLLPGKQTNELIGGFAAPLGSFSARISMCRALALLESHEYDELTVMRRIRNKFGHDLECNDFDHQAVRDLVDQLPWLGPPCPEEQQSRRARFNFAAAILACDLMYREHHARFHSVKDQTWNNKIRTTAPTNAT